MELRRATSSVQAARPAYLMLHGFGTDLRFRLMRGDYHTPEPYQLFQELTRQLELPFMTVKQCWADT